MANAADLWGHNIMPDVGAYRELTKDQFGLYGAVVARGAAQVLRLSLIYALLDCAAEIRWEHLVAALEVWRYCQDSAKHIFGDALGDPHADEILRALRSCPGGMTRTEVGAIFDRTRAARRLDEHYPSLPTLAWLDLRGRRLQDGPLSGGSRCGKRCRQKGRGLNSYLWFWLSPVLSAF